MPGSTATSQGRKGLRGVEAALAGGEERRVAGEVVEQEMLEHLDAEHERRPGDADGDADGGRVEEHAPEELERGRARDAQRQGREGRPAS